MSQEQWAAIDRYLIETHLSPDSMLEAALKSCADAGLPPINVTPNQGKFLQLLAQIAGARDILEIGTLGGYSTIWLARALPTGGRLVTLEVDSRHAEVARTNLARASLEKRVELRVGKALETLPQLAAEGHRPFDFIFIDADKENYPGYFTWALRLSRPGTLIIADNVVRKGAVINPDSDDPHVRGVRRFHELLAREPRINATALQTVGSKGHDGFTLAIVVADNAQNS